MARKFFQKKKSIEKVSLGELKMMKAELEHTSSMLRSEISEIDEMIESTLSTAKQTGIEAEQYFAAREITNFVRTKKDLLQRLLMMSDKKSVLDQLIRIKEDHTSFSKGNTSLFDMIDVESFSMFKDESEIRCDVEKMRVEAFLSAGDVTGEYGKILDVVRAVCLDDESIEVAKVEVASLCA